MLFKNKFGRISLRKDGYYYCSGKKNNGKLLHRLIYEESYGKIPNDKIVHHIDGNKLNNNLNNLELLSKSEHHKLHNNFDSHPLYGTSYIDKQGGMDYLIQQKNKGYSMNRISKELGYTSPVPIHQYLKLRNLNWNDL